MSKIIGLMVAMLAFSIATITYADQEISLFNAEGRATAYIAVDDELTIYLWNGKPVAYLQPSNAGEFHVYGFNGSHLGWFLQGAIWYHDGSASCATREVMNYTQFEPFKGFKQFKPFRSFREFPPFMPSLSGSFGQQPCALLLMSGAK